MEKPDSGLSVSHLPVLQYSVHRAL